MQLVDWRRLKRMTQADVARALGVISISVSRWERGERVPTTKLQVEIFKLTHGRVTPNDWTISVSLRG
jgi:transcriptional regulator with XRE-family HTH domain